MSDTIVELRIALKSAREFTHEGSLAIIQNVMIRYQTKISGESDLAAQITNRTDQAELDQNLASKQALAVADGLVKREQ